MKKRPPPNLVTLLAVSALITAASERVFAQQAPCFNVVLKKGDDHPEVSVKLLDSVLVGKSWRQPVKSFYNVTSGGDSFLLPCVPVGRHMLFASTKEVDIAPLPITVCSKCENVFSFSVRPVKEGENNFLYETVEISPIYTSGQAGLTHDVKIALTKKERNALQKSQDFRVHFFVTKQGETSDPTFTPDTLLEAVKSAIAKALFGLSRWRPAEVNGRVSDGEHTLSKRDLLGE